jgi:short-subunit dehydrogenase
MSAVNTSRPEETVLVVGATSGIGNALARQLAGDGARLLLAGRATEELDRTAADLRIRHGTEVGIERFDALDFEAHPAFVDRCLVRLDGELDGVVVCYGDLPDADLVTSDGGEARRTIDVNLTSVVSLLTPLAEYLRQRRRGWIAVISSVAGDRGRQSNYVYGTAKGGLTVFLQGLRNRLAREGVHVLTIKPGFVATPMLRDVDPSSPLVASPERVARDIRRAIRGRRNVVYTPWFWWPVMMIIRGIPEPIFKRLRL